MKTLAEEVKEATDDKVNAARLELRTLVQRLDSELSKFGLVVHLTAVNQLSILAQYRQQVMQMEAAEMQRQHDLRTQEQAAKGRQAAFDERQKTVAKIDTALANHARLKEEAALDAVATKAVPTNALDPGVAH